jgi:hypothetical protein
MTSTLVAQMHSREYYVRLGCDALPKIVFEHVHSAQDAEVMEDALNLHGAAVTCAGSTEWQGVENGEAVSLAWDWMVLKDGEIELLGVVAPRPNLKLIDVKGYDVTDLHALPHVLGLIKSLPWCIKVRQALEQQFPLTLRLG